MIQSPAFPGATNLYGVTAVQECGNWRLFAISDGKLWRVNVGAQLFSTILPGQITEHSSNLPITIGSFNHIAAAQKGGDIYVYFTSYLGKRLDAAVWRQGVSNAQYIDPGISPLSFSPYALETFSQSGKVGLIVTGFDSGSILDVSIQAPCAASLNSSTAEVPPGLTYSTGGTYPVALTATFAGGITCTEVQEIVVSSNTAPNPVITFNGVCVDAPVTFTGQSHNAVAITAWDWTLDATQSTLENPMHTFGVSGEYPVTLKATAANGCVNYASSAIDIFNKPVAGFIEPSPTVVCTRQGYLFDNTSVFDAGSNVTWSWYIDNTPVSTNEDFSHTFTSAQQYAVKLVASIPGCSSEGTSAFDVQQVGPETAFNFGPSCINTPVDFSITPTPGATYQWDFGDGNSSGDVTADHTFTATGVFNVTLNSSNVAGCLNSTSRQLQVYAVPQPSFSIDLPPFSCAGTPSQFHDATPSPSDNNVNQWGWDFGDNGTGSGKDPVHTYASAGTFNVRLSVTTDKGCTGFTDQEVSIAPSPVAVFTSDATCLNQAVNFTNVSTGDIKSWQWKIGNQVYTTENARHVFAATGNSSAQLTVTGTNDCVSTLTRQVVVPVVPIVDFGIGNMCSAQPTSFADLTSSPADPVAERMWTFNSSATPGGQTASFAFPNAGTFPVKLDIANQSGCTYSVTKQVTINPSPVANFSMSVESGPPPLSVLFTNTSTGATSYQWNFNDGNAVRTETSQEYTFNALGDYDVSLTALGTSGCVSTLTKVVSVIVPYNELALEELSLVESGGGYRGYIRVHNNGNYRIAGFSVTLDVGGGILVTENISATLNPGQTSMMLLSNQFKSPAAGGYICAELQGDNIMLDNKACTAFTGSVVLAPWPNPTDVFLNVEAVLREAGTVRVTLYNSSGGEAYDKTFDAAGGLTRLTLDIQSLSPGMYVAVITAGSTVESRKILIHR
jgi:PKD repeat protein